MGYKVCIKQERVLCNLGYKFEVDTLWTCFIFCMCVVLLRICRCLIFSLHINFHFMFQKLSFPRSLKWPQNVHSWSYLKDACRDTTGMDFDHPWSSRILEFFHTLLQSPGIAWNVGDSRGLRYFVNVAPVFHLSCTDFPLFTMMAVVLFLAEFIVQWISWVFCRTFI